MGKFFSFIRSDKFKQTGKFKGHIEILPEQIIDDVKNLKLSEKTAREFELNLDPDSWGNSKMLKEILKTEKVTVVVYILKAKFADSLDFGS